MKKEAQNSYRLRGFDKVAAPKPKKSGHKSTVIDKRKDLRTK